MTEELSKLGRFEKVDLRKAWATEAGDFTPWLAQEANIRLLGEAIGIELEVEAEEKSVGPFRAAGWPGLIRIGGSTTSTVRLELSFIPLIDQENGWPGLERFAKPRCGTTADRRLVSCV